jgi:hypothetical protein
MKIVEWLDTSGRYFSRHSGFAAVIDPINPDVRRIVINDDPFHPASGVSIHLAEIKEKSQKTFDMIMKELGECDEFKDSTLVFEDIAYDYDNAHTIRGEDVLKFNDVVRFCSIHKCIFYDDRFFILATKDSVILKPGKTFIRRNTEEELLELICNQ